MGKKMSQDMRYCVIFYDILLFLLSILYNFILKIHCKLIKLGHVLVLNTIFKQLMTIPVHFPSHYNNKPADIPILKRGKLDVCTLFGYTV